MEKSEYNINIISRKRLIFITVLILCSSSVILKYYTPKIENKILSFAEFFLVYAASFYIASLIATAKIKVVITNEGILHIWKRRFFLNWEKNVNIPWNVIDNYDFESDRTCDSIIINLTNKTRYKINKLNVLPMKDDFKKLEKDILKLREKNQ